MDFTNEKTDNSGRQAAERAADAALRAADCALETGREAGEAYEAIELRAKEVGEAAEQTVQQARDATEHAAGVYDAAIEISRQAHRAAQNAEKAAACAAEALAQTEETANRVADALERLEEMAGNTERVERIGSSLLETIGPVPQWSASVPRVERTQREMTSNTETFTAIEAPRRNVSSTPLKTLMPDTWVAASADADMEKAGDTAEAPLIASAGDEIAKSFAKHADHVVEVLRDLETAALSVEVSSAPQHVKR